MSVILFLGTGTSTSIPVFNCLSQKPISCKVCKSAVEPLKPESGKSAKFSKNKRRNTSAVIRYKHSDGSIKNIVIDAGKTFYEASMTWFTEYNLRRIDAILLTHGHADAVFGLDDTRMWTSGGKEYQIQDSIQVYLDQSTYQVVSSAFPYLVNTKTATGSGDVAQTEFIIFEAGKPITLFGELKVDAFQVQHGFHSDGSEYFANGFRIKDISYISDTSFVNENALEKIKDSQILVIDGLRPTHHVSHLGFDEALEVCKKSLVKGGLGYFTGMGHNLTHDEINHFARENLKGLDISVEAAYDGLCVSIEQEQEDDDQNKRQKRS